MSNPPTTILAYSLAILVSCQVGCVALSIPSERFDDPADGGGLFGDWRNKSLCAPPHDAHPVRTWDEFASCGGPLDEDPLDPAVVAARKKQKEDEIPWPRFHPVPTRPVFGLQPSVAAGRPTE